MRMTVSAESAGRRERLTQVSTRAARPGASLPRADEVFYAAALAMVLAGALLGRHVLHGGFYLDDWTNWARWALAPSWQDALNAYADQLPSANHIGYPYYATAMFAAFGGHMHWHLAAIAAMSALSSATVYLIVRGLRQTRWLAGALALGVLAWPWSDSTKLWFSASSNQLALLLYLSGLALAIWALRTPGRSRIALTAASLVAYIAAGLMYELMAGPIAVALAVYLLTGERRAALVRWPLDLGVAIGTAVAAASHNPVTEIQTLGGMVTHAGVIADQSVSLMAATVEPFGDPNRWLVLIPVLACFVASLVLVRRRAEQMPLARLALILLAVGVIEVAAGYALLVPAADTYVPLAPGAGNRTNIAAGLGFVTITGGLVTSVLALARCVVAARAALVVVGVIAAVLAIGWTRGLENDIGAWDAAYVEETRALDVLRARVDQPAPGTAVYLFGVRQSSSPGVAGFGWVWDVNGAVKLLWKDPSLSGMPVIPGLGFVCAPAEMYPTLPSGGIGHYQGSPYRAVFVAMDGRTTTVGSRQECLNESRRFGVSAVRG
jgi:hypothetical protein